MPAIESVPVLATLDAFASDEKLTVPLPVPAAPAVTVIHDTLLTAVHAHPVAAVTVVDPEPPVALVVCDEGEMVGTQGAPASLTVNVRPPTVRVPLRGVVEEFAVALNPTVPGPEPDPPDVTVSQPLLLVALHPHPAGAVMVRIPVPPVPATDCDVGEMSNVHGMPVCVTLNVLLPIVTDPLRVVMPVYAAALTVTVPGPVPGDPAVTVIQDELLVAVQPQPAGDVTVMLALPPADVNDCEVGAIVELQEIPA